MNKKKQNDRDIKNKRNDRDTTCTRTKIERNKQIDRIIWSAIYRIKWTRTDIKWNEQKDRETTWTAWTRTKTDINENKQKDRKTELNEQRAIKYGLTPPAQVFCYDQMYIYRISKFLNSIYYLSKIITTT
jgi:hypothetical protein